MKNYSTKIDFRKSIQKIRGILLSMGASHITEEYDKLSPIGIYFQITAKDGQIMNLHIPAKTKEALKELERMKQENPKLRVKANIKQAYNLAWKTIYDWLEANASMIQLKYMDTEDFFVNSPFVVMETCVTDGMVDASDAIKNDIYSISRTELALEVHRARTVAQQVKEELRRAKKILLSYILQYDKCPADRYMTLANKWADDTEVWTKYVKTDAGANQQLGYKITGTSYPAWLAWRGIRTAKKRVLDWYGQVAV